MYHLCRETSNIETVLLERDLLHGDWGSPVGPTRQPRGVSDVGGKRWTRLPKTEPTVMLPGNCGAASHLSPSGFSVIVLTRFERIVDVCLFAVEACATPAPGSWALGRFPAGLRGPCVAAPAAQSQGRGAGGPRSLFLSVVTSCAQATQQPGRLRPCLRLPRGLSHAGGRPSHPERLAVVARVFVTSVDTSGPGNLCSACPVNTHVASACYCQPRWKGWGPLSPPPRAQVSAENRPQGPEPHT